jgi:uncharacterized protein (TIGR02594 family)
MRWPSSDGLAFFCLKGKNMSNYPSWLKLALTFEGTKEIPGDKHNPNIVEFLRVASGGKMLPDETANCAAFAQYCLVKTGFQIPYTLSALALKNSDCFRVIKDPVPGCIVVMRRVGASESWQGHAGFYIAIRKTKYDTKITDSGTIELESINVFGANQDDEVKYKWFDKSLVICYLWPAAALTLPDIQRIAKFRGAEWTNSKMEPLPEIIETQNATFTSIQKNKANNKLLLVWYKALSGLKVMGWVLVDAMKIYPATREAGQAIANLIKGDKLPKENTEPIQGEQSLIDICLKFVKQLLEKLVQFIKDFFQKLVKKG